MGISFHIDGPRVLLSSALFRGRVVSDPRRGARRGPEQRKEAAGGKYEFRSGDGGESELQWAQFTTKRKHPVLPSILYPHRGTLEYFKDPRHTPFPPHAHAMPAGTADAFLSTLERDLRSPPPAGSRSSSRRDRDRDGDRDRDRDRHSHSHRDRERDRDYDRDRDHDRSSRRSNRRRDDEDADDDKYRSAGAGSGRMRGYDDDIDSRKRRHERDHSPRISRR